MQASLTAHFETKDPQRIPYTKIIDDPAPSPIPSSHHGVYQEFSFRPR